MNKAEFKKYVELIMSMCTDYLMEGITQDTFISNLDMINQKIKIGEIVSVYDPNEQPIR